ncbi:hypothetical protein M407DRAFT_3228 [Tulasnella calospora MUT 4182]|uniref:Hemerythrin-like domain-containing protein n=1 Tax=Tulasnella calospora MUT 4182 TaxID=1051891 RepID=A0A0C3LK94_9AGAM|nr:hypothetical protein M407DRAFT_3228 [Tulasnella calospora MUT 4182]
MVHHHHRAEETMYFPFIEEKMGEGRMSGNVAAHEAFSKPFEVFEELIKKLISNPEQWDPKCTMLHHHHSGEETFYFPFIEGKIGAGRMSANVAAHEAFSKPFETFEELVKKLISNPELWDAKVFRDSVHSFMPVLREHLAEELTTLDAAELRKYITLKDFEQHEKEFMEEIKKTISFSKGPQVAYVNGDSVNGDWFPPFPGPLTFIVKYGLYWVHSDMWEFGSCDKHKRVKAPFAPYEPPAKLQN